MKTEIASDCLNMNEVVYLRIRIKMSDVYDEIKVTWKPILLESNDFRVMCMAKRNRWKMSTQVSKVPLLG